ncbi:synapsin-2-like isoform X1 [Anolis carolinensis]|uniref:synapsin-2-like isoform X1 n=1 Tax=Anolis carolinensis TaxID=28377 RepID=UPI002F2B6832
MASTSLVLEYTALLEDSVGHVGWRRRPCPPKGRTEQVKTQPRWDRTLPMPRHGRPEKTQAPLSLRSFWLLLHDRRTPSSPPSPPSSSSPSSSSSPRQKSQASLAAKEESVPAVPEALPSEADQHPPLAEHNKPQSLINKAIDFQY